MKIKIFTLLIVLISFSAKAQKYEYSISTNFSDVFVEKAVELEYDKFLEGFIKAQNFCRKIYGRNINEIVNSEAYQTYFFVSNSVYDKNDLSKLTDSQWFSLIMKLFVPHDEFLIKGNRFQGVDGTNYIVNSGEEFYLNKTDRSTHGIKISNPFGELSIYKKGFRIFNSPFKTIHLLDI